MQDMLNPRSRSTIRDIPIPANHRHVRTAEEDAHTQSLSEELRKKPRRRWPWFVLAVVIIGAVGGLLLSTVWQGATITLYPKTQNVTTPITLMAEPNAPTGQLAYQVVTVRQAASTTATASGTQRVSQSASGLITIYNAYSTASQPLVATTRFETPNGNIYRIHTSITVPGESTGSSGAMVPGSVTVTVYADQPGAAYNLPDATQLTIPGFNGGPRYTKFTAQSQGPISGGFVGTQPAVSAMDLTQAETALKQQLNGALQSTLTSNVPPGFMLIGGTSSVTYDPVSQSTGGGTSVTISQNASVVAAVVRESDLAGAVATQAVQGYQGEAVAFSDPSKVTIALPTGSPAQTTGSLSFIVDGTPALVWQIDPTAIKQALAGKPKASFEQIIQGFEPAVAGAQATIRPLWRATFPSDVNKITVAISQSSQ